MEKYCGGYRNDKKHEDVIVVDACQTTLITNNKQVYFVDSTLDSCAVFS